MPIPGTRRIERLDENAAATRIELTESDLDRIEQTLATSTVSGTRYPEASMGTVNR